MSAKKRSSNSEDEVQEKRRRVSVDDEDNDVDEHVSNEGSNVEELRAGYIEKVLMVNFMCHTKLEVILNKRINFIVGRNGSGKSAILSAVVIALGGNASSTNRASSLKDFIKNGESNARVDVTVTNTGLYSYKPEVYGPRIIISRKITYALSTYRIISSTGTVITTKRDELKKIITCLNIQVDNPISVLNQDTARTFLASSDTKSKYSLFMKATRLDDVDNLHSTTLVYEANAKHRLEMREESLKQQEQEIKDLEKKANNLNALKELQKKVAHLENEYFWAVARDEEAALKEIQRKIDKEKEKSTPLTNSLQKRKDDLFEAKKELSETQCLCDNMSKKVQEAESQITSAKQHLQDKRSEYKSSLKEYVTLDKEYHQIQDDITSIIDEITKFSSGDSALIAKEKERMKKEQEVCKQHLSKMMAIYQTTEMEYSNLIGEYEHYREQINIFQKEKMNVKYSIGPKVAQLDRLKLKADNLVIFGEWMPRLVRRIEESYKQGRFVRKPLGPLGSVLKVKDERWARAIEMETGSVLRSFACHCGKDAQVLAHIFKEFNLIKNPGILVSKFTDQLHRIQGSSVKAPGYSNIFDMLVIQDVNVANFLIDNCGIEGILLIPTGQEAAKMMSSDVPANCKKSITTNADQYFPYPDYRMYAGNKRARTCLLQTNAEDAIRSLEAEIRADEKLIVQIDAKIMEYSELIKDNGGQKKNVDERKMSIRREISKINQKIDELQNSIDDLPNSQNMISLTNEKAALEEKASVLMEKSKKALLISDERKTAYNAAQEAFEQLRASTGELRKARQNIQSELGAHKEKVLKKESEVKDYEEMVTSHSNKLNKMSEVCVRQKEKSEKATEEALAVSPERIISKRDVPTIRTEWTDLKSYETVVGRESGITPEAIDILHDKQAKFSDNMQRMRTLQRGLEILSTSLQSRKALYVLIRRVMALKVSYVFRILLSQRGYKGAMTFKHSSRVLEVQISPRQEQGKRETKSLSGGERSYSTVSFILALWECVEPPFYFMDEFDVFMDKLNRRIVINLLLIQARQSKKHQFVFLTPQDISSVEGGHDITIHKLDDPERNKGSSK